MAATQVTHRIALRDMTERDLRTVRRIDRAVYSDAWPARMFDDELRNRFAQYRVAVDEPANDTGAGGPTTGARAALARAVGWRRSEAPAIVGFMGVWFMVDQLHLVTLAVDPPQQGRGIGRRLLLDCFDLCLEAELPSIVLEVRESNDRARRLYEEFGFREEGRLRGYYQDNGEDALVMLAERLDGPDAAAAHRARWHAFRRRYGDAFAR